MSDLSRLVDDLETGPVPSVDVPVLLDPEAAATHRQLETELRDVQRSPGDAIGDRGAAQIAQEIADLFETARPTVFRFAPLTPEQWADLIAAHPPAKGERSDVDVKSFWPVAMAACCIEPEGATADEFVRLRDSGRISNGQWNMLISGVREANEGTFQIRPTRAASSVLRQFSLSSPTAGHAESPDPPS